MSLFVVNEARDVGLQASQWIALLVATILVAGLCVWIISWEDEEDTTAESVTAAAPISETPMTPVTTDTPQAS
jgi:hypothetical protein